MNGNLKLKQLNILKNKLNIRKQDFSVIDNFNDELLPEDSELFELNTPDCVSSKKNYPIENNTEYFPARLKYNGEPLYDNQWCKWKNRGIIGVFKSTPNLVIDPEDLTTDNWSSTNLTATISSYTWQGMQFTELTSTSNGGHKNQNITFSSDGIKAVQIILKKGTTETDTRVLLYDTTASTARLILKINWNYYTLEVNAGTLQSIHWYGDVVELLAVTDSITYTNTNQLRIQPSYSGTGTVYATAVQVEDAIYCTPYTPTSRADGVLYYNYTSQNENTIECWVYPWFSYDDTSRNVWQIGSYTVANRICLMYQAANDKFQARLDLDGSNYQICQGNSSFIDNTTFRQWHHLKVIYNIANQTIILYQDGVEQTDITGAGNVTTLDPEERIKIGLRGVDLWFDGLITDFCVWGSENESIAHYEKDRPYYSKNRLLGQDTKWRLS